MVLSGFKQKIANPWHSITKVMTDILFWLIYKMQYNNHSICTWGEPSCLRIASLRNVVHLTQGVAIVGPPYPVARLNSEFQPFWFTLLFGLIACKLLSISLIGWSVCVKNHYLLAAALFEYTSALTQGKGLLLYINFVCYPRRKWKLISALSLVRDSWSDPRRGGGKMIIRGVGKAIKLS